MSDRRLGRTGIPIRALQALGLTTAGLVFGQTAALSFIATPALLQAPSPLLAKQWWTLYSRAFVPGVTASWVTTGVLWTLLFNERQSSAFTARLYLGAALLFTSITPWTQFMLMPVNKRLKEKKDQLATVAIEDTTAEVGIKQEDTVHALVDLWATLNLGRVALSGVGLVLGAWASVRG